MWCGPEDAEELHNEFMSLYGRNGRRLPGNIFIAATDEEVREYHAALASRKLGKL